MKVDFWSYDKNTAVLYHATIDQAIESFLEKFEIGKAPETVTLYGYRQMEITEKTKERLAESVIEHALEHLDENYAGEDYTDPTPEMQLLAKDFVEKFVKEYHVWRCDIVTEKTIDIKNWLNPEKTRA